MERTDAERRKKKQDEIAVDELIIEGELVEDSSEVLLDTVQNNKADISREKDAEIGFPKTEDQKSTSENTVFYFQYIFLPIVFLTVTLLGGLRIGIKDSEFLFIRPALICLIFAAILIVLFFRAKLINLEGWFNEKFTTVKNIANGLVLLTLFSASTQVFNSLIPESGLPFWIISFCFFWTLWNNIFAEFDTRKLLQSLGGLFGLAFVVKYLVLANLVSAEEGSWLSRIWQNPTKEAFTYFLDIPRFSGTTGYIQFFTLVFYLIGLFLIKPSSPSGTEKAS